MLFEKRELEVVLVVVEAYDGTVVPKTELAFVNFSVGKEKSMFGMVMSNWVDVGAEAVIGDEIEGYPANKSEGAVGVGIEILGIEICGNEDDTFDAISRLKLAGRDGIVNWSNEGALVVRAKRMRVDRTRGIMTSIF